MKKLLLFVREYIFNFHQTWSIVPSSRFLANKMVNKKLVNEANVIVELWAWTWVFTKKIFENIKLEDNKKIFIVEKNIDFYDQLKKDFKKYESCLYNEDVLNISKLLSKNWIKKVDLVISWLPFKSLPKKIFLSVFDDFFAEYLDENSVFVQFSYFKSYAKTYEKYFEKVELKRCLLNIPVAYVFVCSWFKKINNKNQ